MSSFAGEGLLSTAPLVHGCDVIFKWLRYSFSPVGFMYRFDEHRHEEQRHGSTDNITTVRARALNLRVIAYLIIMIVTLPFALVSIVNFLIYTPRQMFNDESTIITSQFVRRAILVSRISKIVSLLVVLSLLIVHHGPLASIIASSTNSTSIDDQKRIARGCIAAITFAAFGKGFMTGLTFALGPPDWQRPVQPNNLAASTLIGYVAYVIEITYLAPLMIVCYMGATLGRHVENFSNTYIDSLFDQFSASSASSQESHRSAEAASIGSGARATNKFVAALTRLVHISNSIYAAINKLAGALKRLLARIRLRNYPELPEMKMTKLSSSAEITDTMRSHNNRLTRERLRKSQIMLSQLRDWVSDINKLASPVTMIYILNETIVIVLIATASIELHVYKTLNPYIFPTLMESAALMLNTLYFCRCLDDTSSQLKLMMNKLFDFIIMNQRVDKGSQQMSRSRSMQDELMLDETWSQFQYTRKLSNTIYFTTGGIITVSRRLVLSILGHVLSFVLVAVEIMSIIDTQSH